MIVRIAKTSPRSKARAAGFFWLMTVLAGSYAATGDSLIVAGDAAATATNILANEFTYRLALAANIVAGACYLAATVLVYDLLKPVNRNLSMLAAFFSVVGCAIGGVNFVLHLSPLVVLGGAPYLVVFTAQQLQALSLAFLGVRTLAFFISHIFFGLHCLLVGYLILGSTFLPRFIGALMVFAGLGWLTMGFSNLLSPSFGHLLVPYIVAPGAIGEISITLWFLVFGVNVERWKEQANASTNGQG